MFPQIVECGHYQTAVQHTEQDADISRTVKDYELDFHLSGERVMTLEGVGYTLPDHCLIARHPGQKVTSRGVFDMYTLTLDFTEGAEWVVGTHMRHVSRPIQTAKADFWATFPAVFVPRHGDELLALYQQLSVLYTIENRRTEAGLLVGELLTLALTDAFHTLLPRQQTASPVDRALAFLHEHYTENLTLDTLAEAVYLDKSYLSRLFKAETGTTPMAYLNRYRLARAKRALEMTRESICDIAFAYGFPSPAYFAYLFRREYGISPKEARK